MRNSERTQFPSRWREDHADYERSIGIPDRGPITDARDAIDLPLQSHGGKRWRIEPRLGYTSCRLIDVDSGAVEICGTLKQVFRFLSRQQPHRLGLRNLQ